MSHVYIDQIVDMLFQELDVDNSGQIEAMEVAKRFAGQLTEEEIDLFMKEIDKDGDGSINRSELKRYLLKYLGKKK